MESKHYKEDQPSLCQKIEKQKINKIINSDYYKQCFHICFPSPSHTHKQIIIINNNNKLINY